MDQLNNNVVSGLGTDTLYEHISDAVHLRSEVWE
jgi:hypothetical protein